MNRTAVASLDRNISNIDPFKIKCPLSSSGICRAITGCVSGFVEGAITTSLLSGFSKTIKLNQQYLIARNTPRTAGR